MRRLFNLSLPTHWVYILVHSVLFLLGIIIIVLANNAIVQAVGTSIIAAGITGWVVFVYILFNQKISQRLTLLSNFGFRYAFEARSVKIRDEYDKRLEHAKEHIDIMGFGLRSLREDYLNQFPDWIQKANVRILLIDPEYPVHQYSYAGQRDKEELNGENTIDTDVKQFLEQTRELRQGDVKNKFEIRLYKCLPSINIFRIDDELFWGPYLIKDQSRNCPTFLVEKGGILYKRYLSHFDEIWNSEEFSRNL